MTKEGGRGSTSFATSVSRHHRAGHSRQWSAGGGAGGAGGDDSDSVIELDTAASTSGVRLFRPLSPYGSPETSTSPPAMVAGTRDPSAMKNKKDAWLSGWTVASMYSQDGDGDGADHGLAAAGGQPDWQSGMYAGTHAFSDPHHGFDYNYGAGGEEYHHPFAAYGGAAAAPRPPPGPPPPVFDLPPPPPPTTNMLMRSDYGVGVGGGGDPYAAAAAFSTNRHQQQQHRYPPQNQNQQGASHVGMAL
jgi:hypothetical protein